MDIKLRARLSAYSKIESLPTSTTIPDPDVYNSGNVLGVNDEGRYTLFPQVENEDIDELFTDTDLSRFVTKEEIDTLFDKQETNDSEDNLSDTSSNVSKADIDSLFQ